MNEAGEFFARLLWQALSEIDNFLSHWPLPATVGLAWLLSLSGEPISIWLTAVAGYSLFRVSSSIAWRFHLRQRRKTDLPTLIGNGGLTLLFLLLDAAAERCAFDRKWAALSLPPAILLGYLG